jgi:multiple sugar transport system substrate-binding protein
MRITTLGIALALGAVTLAGCGGAAADTEREATSRTVRLWIMNNGPDPVRDTERIVAPFERRTGIDVKVELVDWTRQFDRIRTAARTGEGPDITQAGTTQVPFFATLDGFEDLSARVRTIGGAAAYTPAVWDTTRLAGREGTWAVPWFTEARAVYYRKDLLRAAGVDPRGAFSTWASFRRTLSRLRGARAADGTPVAPFGSPGAQAFDLVHHVAPFVWGAGGSELSADRRRSTIADPKARAGVMYFANLLRDGLYTPKALEQDSAQVETEFKRGHLAVWIGGPWTLASTSRKDDREWTGQARRNVGIAPLPQGPADRGYTFVGGSNLMMFKASRHKDEAWELIRFLSESSTQRAYAGLSGMFPARHEPQREEGRRDANHAAFLRAIELGRTYPALPQWGQIENAYKTRFGTILRMAAGQSDIPYSDRTVAAQLRSAARGANALLAQG